MNYYRMPLGELKGQYGEVNSVKKKKVNQSHYRPGEVQRVAGS